jgi:hypothetical protein
LQHTHVLCRSPRCSYLSFANGSTFSFLCNRTWINQRMNLSSSSNTHHPTSIPLVSLCRWEILDNFIKTCKHCVNFQGYRNHVIKGVGKRCWLEWSINMPSCATHSTSICMCMRCDVTHCKTGRWYVATLSINVRARHVQRYTQSCK